MRHLVRAVIGAWLAVALGAGCADDADVTSPSGTTRPSTSATTTTATTATGPGETTTARLPGEFGDCGGSAPSASRFDPESGQYYAWLMGIDVEQRSIDVDVLQLLAGEAATEAYHREFPDDADGPPNGFWTVNENATVYQLAVDQDVEVRLVRLRDDGNPDVGPGTFEELPGYLADYRPPEPEPQLSWNPFWLTLENGRVTTICEQYIP